MITKEQLAQWRQWAEHPAHWPSTGTKPVILALLAEVERLRTALEEATETE